MLRKGPQEIQDMARTSPGPSKKASQPDHLGFNLEAWIANNCMIP